MTTVPRYKIKFYVLGRTKTGWRRNVLRTYSYSCEKRDTLIKHICHRLKLDPDIKWMVYEHIDFQPTDLELTLHRL